MSTSTSSTKKCAGPCGLEKPVTAFYSHSCTKDGRYGQCAECYKNRIDDPVQFLRQKYIFMLQRVRGSNSNATRPTNSWLGKEICSRDEFIEWSLEQEDFRNLFIPWRAAGKPRHLNPSIDRLDNSKGYSLDNLRWVTQSENSRRFKVTV